MSSHSFLPLQSGPPLPFPLSLSFPFSLSYTFQRIIAFGHKSVSSISAQLTLELSSILCPLLLHRQPLHFFFRSPCGQRFQNVFAKANSLWRHRTFQKKIWPFRNLLLLVSPYPLTGSIHPGEWAQSEEGALGILLVRLRSSVNASIPTTMDMTGHQGGGLGQPPRPSPSPARVSGV